MVGLDTNVLVRYLVWDDEGQAQKAAACIRKVTDAGSSCRINLIVFCELVWVLESAYGYGREEIAEACEKILLTKQLEIEERDIVRKAVAEYRKGRADMADYIIGKVNIHNGCRRTYTFDRSLKNCGDFELIE
jgi:predicted nucleic-acid-binding protein